MPVNTALASLVDNTVDLTHYRPEIEDNDEESKTYASCMDMLETLATFLRPAPSSSTGNVPTQLSRPMQRKLVALINCQLLEAEGRSRAIKAARSLGERSVTELILQHQNPQQLSTNLWAAVRARGCQFLGPAMQEEVLKLVLLALEDGSALSRKVLVMFVVQRLEPQFPQASKTSIGHVVQLLYRASCFKVTKRDSDSSLMQLKEEFNTYETLRREHDAQIVQIATEAGLRIAPDQWSSLLYGDPVHKSHMQSIIDKLQTPQSFVQSVQELVIALQRTGDPGQLTALRPHLDHLASIEVSEESEEVSDWNLLMEALNSCCSVVSGLLVFINHHNGKKIVLEQNEALTNANARYKTSMCRDFGIHKSCPRGKNCTFAHSMAEIEAYRGKKAVPRKSQPFSPKKSPNMDPHEAPLPPMPAQPPPPHTAVVTPQHPPVAQVAPLPRGNVLVAQQPQPIFEQQVLNFPMQVQLPIFQHPHPEMSHVTPPAPDHLEELRRNQTSPEEQAPESANGKLPRGQVARLATKSLGALKSRKEQIIDTLEDIVGRDEMERLAQITQDHAKAGKSVGALSAAIGVSTGSSSVRSCEAEPFYSIWTSKSVATIPVSSPASDASPSNVYSSYVGYFSNTPDDEMIPFSDTPIVSRFGPISRRGTSISRPSKPSQSVATIDDEPTPTAVVRHSKQMTKQLPPSASLILQNGGRTTLQPVAVGANGEIGYIAVAESISVPGTPVQPPIPHQIQTQVQAQAQVQPQMQQQPSPVQVMIQAGGPQGGHIQDQSNMDPAAVYAESERMKHELEVLQKKISDLNMAQQQFQLIQQQKQQLHMLVPGAMGAAAVGTDQQQGQQQQQAPIQQQQQQQPNAEVTPGHNYSPRHIELASELQLIEKTIKDREMELQINTCMQKDSPKGLDYGSYISHGELISLIYIQMQPK